MHRVQRFDCRLVVHKRRKEWRRADEIAGAHDNRIGVARRRTREMRCKVPCATSGDVTNLAVGASWHLERAMKVVDAEDLQRNDTSRSRLCRQNRGEGQRTN